VSVSCARNKNKGIIMTKKEENTVLLSVNSTQLLNANKIRRDERKRIWDELNKHIKTGHLKGNGLDKMAERNGLILATNIIFKLGI